MNSVDYQRLALRTECHEVMATLRIADMNKYKPQATRLIHAAFGLSSEVGEFTDSLKKTFFYNQYLDIQNLKEELGDCLWYIAIACDALEVGISSIMEANIRKLKKRYPEKYTNEKAAEENRDREAEQAATIKTENYDWLNGILAQEAEENRLEEEIKLGNQLAAECKIALGDSHIKPIPVDQMASYLSGEPIHSIQIITNEEEKDGKE